MPHAFSMHFCECFQWSKEHSWWNLVLYVFSRVDLDLCLWNTENSDFPRILSKNVALQRRAILYVFYEGNCNFGCILYNRIPLLGALILDFMHFLWVFGTFRRAPLWRLWKATKKKSQKWSFCLGRMQGFGSSLAQRPRDAPASPNPP